MLFGDKNTFAIECALDQDYSGEWMNGEIYYWIDGVKLGGSDFIISLRDSLSQMKWPIKDSGTRHGGSLCSLPPEEAFELLDRSIYGEHQSDKDTFLIPETPARFQIDAPLIDGRWKIFLIQCGDQEHFLYRLAGGEIKSFAGQSGAFDNTLKEAREYLNEIYERESSSFE